MKKFILILLMAFSNSIASADIVVLVHGYLGSPMSWQTSGVNQQLTAAGWKRAGDIFETRSGIMLSNVAKKPEDHEVYAVKLPSMAPANVQAEILHRMITDLQKRHPDEKITLVGHSAGGLVSRIMLVRYGNGNVDKLITIASPHLGTHLAVRALDETHNVMPVGMIKSFFGGRTYHTAKASIPLLVDLVPPRPGNFLYWLNQQPHPDIEYIAVVRGRSLQMNGDRVIPGFSQDMNRIPALQGRSQVYYIPSTHFLSPLDGEFLTVLLEDDF